MMCLTLECYVNSIPTKTLKASIYLVWHEKHVDKIYVCIFFFLGGGGGALKFVSNILSSFYNPQ